MSKSAPDTRNKLDDNKNLRKSGKSNKKPLNLQTFVQVSDKSTKDTKPLTKGQEFAIKFGFSRSVARAMRRNGIDVPKTIEGYGTEQMYALETYREVRKKRKRELRKIRQKKHSDSVAIKKHSGKGKGKKTEPKKKETKLAA